MDEAVEVLVAALAGVKMVRLGVLGLGLGLGVLGLGVLGLGLGLGGLGFGRLGSFFFS